MNKTSKKIWVSNGVFAYMEIHAKKDVPEYYPDKTEMIGDRMLALSQLHSQYYQPTPEAQEKLMAKIQAAKSWCYLIPKQGRVREN